MRDGALALILWVLLLALTGCGRPSPAPSSSAAISTDEALARVKKSLPAVQYVSNEMLSDTELPAAGAEGVVVKLRVGLPWVLNDEIAPWFVGIEKGFYRDEGLDLELVPGGPGIDPLQLLVGGRLDIAVPPSGVGVVELMASPTRADLVAIGAVLKGSPYCWLGIDNSVPRDQPSTRRLQPTDFIGKNIGLQPGSDFIANFLVTQYHLPDGALHIKRAGFTPDPLLAGVVDYYGAFIVNQPRIVEQAGYRNWDAFRFADWGWTDFGDVSVARRDTFTQRPETLRRYLRATGRALQFILDHPDDAAEITSRRSVDVPLTPAMVRRRFDLERDLIVGAAGSRLQEMPLDSWDLLAAHLLSSGTVSLPAPRTADAASGKRAARFSPLVASIQ